MKQTDPKSPDEIALPEELREIVADLSRKDRAILCHVLRRPGDSLECVAEQLGMSRSTVTRRLNSGPVQAALSAAYERMVEAVESEARRGYLQAFERFSEIFEPGSLASNTDVIRAFAQLREMLSAVETRKAADGDDEHRRPIGVVVVPFCEHCEADRIESGEAGE